MSTIEEIDDSPCLCDIYVQGPDLHYASQKMLRPSEYVAEHAAILATTSCTRTTKIKIVERRSK